MIESPLLPETPDQHGAFPRLSDTHIATLARHGERRRARAGEVLCREGDEAGELIVILEGKVAAVEVHGGDERLLAVLGRRRFLGELSLLTEQAALVTLVVRELGEVLAVPVPQLRQLAVEDPALGDLILRACFLRRSLLIELGIGMRIVGSRYSPDARRLREFAARNRVPHRWIDLEEDQQAESLLRELGVAPRVASAVGEGAMAVRLVHEHLERAGGPAGP